MMKGWTRSTSMRMAPLKRRRSYWQTIAIGLPRKNRFTSTSNSISRPPPGISGIAGLISAMIRTPFHALPPALSWKSDKLAQQTFRVEPAIGEPDTVGIHEGELPACAGIIHRQPG